MGESDTHGILVGVIKKWIEINFDNENICLFMDSGINLSAQRPKLIKGHVPDVYAESLYGEKRKIVGEAKTARDLDSKRSEKQLKAFLENCAIEKACFVLAVPWDMTRYAKSLIRYYQKQLNIEGVDTIIICELGF